MNRCPIEWTFRSFGVTTRDPQESIRHQRFTLYDPRSIMLHTIRRQTLALIAEITAQPKPSYTIDGQSVDWADYLAQLQKTVEWCDRRIAHEEPVEITSTAR